MPQEPHWTTGGLRQTAHIGPPVVRAATPSTRPQTTHSSWYEGSLLRQVLQIGAPVSSRPATGRVRPHHLQGSALAWL
ncbi:hypothetical protein GCM10020254_87200 [Streptomyces goshikiensis]